MNNIDRIIKLTHGKWPNDSVKSVSLLNNELVQAHPYIDDNGFTKPEYGKRLKELSGRPDVKDWPEWANCCAQDENGLWHVYDDDSTVFPNFNEWETSGECKEAHIGNTITSKSWENSLITREEAEMVDKNDNDWLKPSIECEYDHPSAGWTGCTTIGWFRDRMVCAPNGGGFYQGYKDEFRPVKTDKEEWVEKGIRAIEHEYAYYGELSKEKLNLEETKRQLGAIYDAGLAKT